MGLNPLTDTAFTFEDVLLDTEFMPSIKIANIGGNAYPYIVCERVIDWIIV